ncbi:hypothetical protein EV182_000560, partial [Spiromyces aspiralis]
MVKFFQQTFSFDFPWASVTYAYLNRYPNPYASHVLATDTLYHNVDQETGNLHIARLLLKTNSVPRWGRAIMKGNSTAYILEEIEVDPINKVFKTKTRNITHTRMLKVEEAQTIKASPEDPENHTTGCNETRIVSNFGYGLNSKIESFSLSRFRNNITK